MIRYGLQSVFRNGWLSLATVLVLVIALLVFEGLILFRVVTAQAVATLEDKIDIAVYFKASAPEDEILGLSRSLEDLKEVKRVQYVSRDRALEIFKERTTGDPTIAQALGELDENPLLASLSVNAHDPNDYDTIASYIESKQLVSIVEKVTYSQSRRAIDRLASIVGTAETMGLTLTIFFAFVAALVTFNTVRLAIYSNREEIGIMRLVGGSNRFINGPYVVQGVVLGAFAAIVSLLIVAPFIKFADPYLEAFVPGTELGGYFLGHLPSLLGYQLFFGIGLAVASSAVAIRRYLKI
jgi:cell division transport system permease protein